jgi:MFS superfamily sulfate permease-like transporter
LWNLRHYQRGWLARDVFAGLVPTTVLLPTGMGYATAAGLPPITGLYATTIPLVAYAVFGPSPLLVLGPDSSLTALIAAAVIAPAAGDPERTVALASLLALLSGAVCVAAGLLRAGGGPLPGYLWGRTLPGYLKLPRSHASGFRTRWPTTGRVAS